MSLVIKAPVIEQQLRREAAKRGVSPSEFATDILRDHLSGSQSEIDPHTSQLEPKFDAGWTQAFDDWVASHVRTTPLSNHAVSREGIYEGRY